LKFSPKWPYSENNASFPGKLLFFEFPFQTSQMEDVTKGNARAIKRR
jgi:hypothetical protein